MIRVPQLRHARAVLWSALLASSVTAAEAQDPDPLAKLDPGHRAAVEAIVDSARAANLPSRPLYSKAILGVRKGADGRTIVNAVRKQLASLRSAESVLGPVDEEELTAAAAVLTAGAKPAQLASFRSREKGRSDLDAFTVWADLITRGVPSEDASSAITKLWQDGADDATFLSLWKNVQSDILQGLNPGAALQNRVRETPARLPKVPPDE